MCYYNVSRHVASNLNIKSDADEALLDSQDQYLHKPKKFKSFPSSILQILKNDTPTWYSASWFHPDI